MSVRELNDDYGLICVCAMRYALGRQTYMPSIVQRYIRTNINMIRTADIAVMIKDIDCEIPFIRLRGLGDPDIDAPAWINFRNYLLRVREERGE